MGKKVECEHCFGKGMCSCDYCDGMLECCPACGGHYQAKPVVCPECNGTGKVDEDD